VLPALAAFATVLQESGPASSDDVLYVWSFDTDQESSDFLAVIDADSGSLLETVPVGLIGGAHHTEHRMPVGNVFFANSFTAGTTFRFDVSNPRAPRIEGSFVERGPYTFPHSFERLSNGNVLATFHHRDRGSGEPGGLVELDSRGNYLRGADAADPDVDPDLRPYSLAILPELDRVVTTTADMHGELLARSVQLWRLSDLALSKTLLLPKGERGDENFMPAEPRVLADGRSVIVSTFSCGLYLLTELASESPTVTHLKTFPYEPPHRCALPVRLGDYWVQTVPTSESLVSLDVSDPLHPKLVQELKLGADYRPHWISADSDGDRIVVTGRGAMEHRLLLVRFDPRSGRMELDRSISFDRETWPHGETGTATPHGALFYH
jgi:hypothetical protein